MFLSQPPFNQPLYFPLPQHCTFPQQTFTNPPQNLVFQTLPQQFNTFNISPQFDPTNSSIIFPNHPQYIQVQETIMVPVIIGPFYDTEPQVVDTLPRECTSEDKSKEEIVEIRTPETEASPNKTERDLIPLEQEDLNQETKKIEKMSKKIKKVKKIYREKFSARAEKILKSWYMENFYDPYPMTEEKINLAKECGISINQVNSWFKNVRQIQAEIPCKFANAIEKALRAQ